MTTGEVIRALKPYFDCTYDLNQAVSDFRQGKPSFNWYDAAKGLLTELQLKEKQNGTR